MKKHLIFLVALCVLIGDNAVAQNDFKHEFTTFDSLPNRTRLVHNGAITPRWIDSISFAYETRNADGVVFYNVDVVKKSKTKIDEKDFPKSPERSPSPSNRDTVPSPDGKWTAYIFDNNLWIEEIGEKEKKEKVKLSFDGTANNFYTNQIHWSPDSRKIAVLKRQDAPQRKIPLIESAPSSQLQPLLQWRDYFKPGDLIPINRPTLFDVATKTQIEINAQPFEHQYRLRNIKWINDSKNFIFEFNERGHQAYQVVSVNAETGKTFVVIDERSRTFIYYNRNYLHYMEDGQHVLWASERDNWRHLYMIELRTGQVKRQITKGEWVVRDVIHINEKENYMIISGNGMNQNKGEDPYNIHFYRVNLRTGNILDLTPEQANHRAFFSPDFKYFVNVYSKPDTPPVSVLRNATDGKIEMELQTADISQLLATGFTMPEVFHTKGRDGKTDIWGTIFRPSNFDPSKKYPIVEYIYAGPHDAFVDKNFSAYARFSKLNELGFIVVSIDGMGTANRSKSFHDVCWRNLKDAGFPDRIIWIKEAAKKYSYMDIENVGIYGYSAGGQSTLGALLFHGDFYKVGVSLCGCHDNRMDKIWWNEQWMGYPIGPWYAENSNVDNAHKLEGKLLLINGELDDNVDPTSTLQVVNALVKADKDFEQLYLPGYGHGLGDNYVTRKVFEFFVKHMRK
ncbi:MAG: S9 family peptidase [Bacteroidales bacterium]|jgi:dipeptidyl aminopeptidase/acylaminoacyl peptidase|nr:S9 family peptidase [Bacteroidales bacterium]